MTINFEADALVVKGTNSQLKAVSHLADQLVALREEEDRITARLKAIAAKRRDLEERELPEAMDGCGMASLKLTSGAEIVVEQVVSGSIPKKNEEEAFKWLSEHGHAGLIKSNVSVSLARGETTLSGKIVTALKKYKGVEVTEKQTVHPQTLGAWAREQLSHGVNIPTDLLGIWVGRKAKVKEAK